MSPRFPSATDVLDELVSLAAFERDEEVDVVEKVKPPKFKTYRVPHSRQDRYAPTKIHEKVVIREGF